MYMELTKKQRLSVCCVLLDVIRSMSEEGGDGLEMISRTRHYPVLEKVACLTGSDWAEAEGQSVLASLAQAKELHYKVKMMIGLVVHDLYSKEPLVPYHQRLCFDILMTSMDWPVSFKEISCIENG